MRPLVLLVGRTPGWREVLARRDAELVELRAMDRLADPTPGHAPGNGPGNGPGSSIDRPPAGAFVELASEEDEGLRAIARIKAEAPEAAIVAVAAEKDPDLILRAMRAGAGEFVLASDELALRTTLHEIVGRRAGSARVVSVLPVRGGVGATTIAVNLAIALAEGGSRVALVDLDFHLGDVMLFLDLDRRLAISDLLANEDRMDGELLLSSLPRYGERVWVAAQTGPVESRDRVGAADIPRLVAMLKPHFDYLVLDGLRGFGDHTRRALAVTDRLLLVVTQEIPAVKNAQLCLAYLAACGFEGARVHVIANRVQKHGAPVELDQMEEFLGRPIAGRVANDYNTVSRAIRDGRPLADEAPRTAVTREVAEIATLVSGHHEARRGGLFQALFGRHRAVNEQEGAHDVA